MAKARKRGNAPETFATNRKARHDYAVLETHEAGLQLKGTEIKSIRQHRVSLDDSFARIDEGELFLYNMHVSPYEQGGRENVEPTRPRKLMMHRQEIDRLTGLMAQKRAVLVPLRLYQKRNLAKIELAVARGKRVFDKRSRIREREIERDLRRRIKDSRQKRKR